MIYSAFKLAFRFSQFIAFLFLIQQMRQNQEDQWINCAELYAIDPGMIDFIAPKTDLFLE